MYSASDIEHPRAFLDRLCYLIHLVDKLPVTWNLVENRRQSGLDGPKFLRPRSSQEPLAAKLIALKTTAYGGGSEERRG
jgi:hypothetical protein